jgi:type II secretory pathway pseudopilin PulG
MRRDTSHLTPDTSHLTPPPRGITLIELLVVLLVLMILAGATIPRLKPGMDRTRTREAARAVQLYIDSARNLAMSTGRTCGVMIERLPSVTDSDGCMLCSMTLTQVETPPNYCGDTLSSVVKVSPWPAGPGGAPSDNAFHCAIAFNTYDNPPPLFPGDQIQFNFQGPWYTLDPVTSNGGPNQPLAGGAINTQNVPVYATLDPSKAMVLPWQSQPITVPYAIRRWPTKSAAESLQLPSPAVIDLTCSGPDPPPGWTLSSFVPGQVPPSWAPAPSGSPSTAPITIMFSPNGSVDRSYANTYSGASTTGGLVASPALQPFYLLVGKIEQVQCGTLAVTPGTPANVADLTNVWIAINPATGLVVTSEMYPYSSNTPSDPNLSPTEQTSGSQLFVSRHFARQSSAMGGK